jgi:rod shape-determining protein MreB and related proteins
MAAAADLAADLGSCTLRVSDRNGNVLARRAAVVAVRQSSTGRQVVAIGEKAKQMIGRSPPEISVVRPIRGGIISDFEIAGLLIKDVLKEVGGRSLRGPRLLMSVSGTMTDVERRAARECTRAAGARGTILVPCVAAAALGAELPIAEAIGSLVVDIGGGHTDMAVLSIGGTVVGRSIHAAGEAFDKSIRAWLRNDHELLVGEHTAELVKLTVGAADDVEDPRATEVRGRDVKTAAPRRLSVTSAQVAHALAEPLGLIRHALREVLSATPPELAADIVDRGLMLTGASSALPGLTRVLSDDANLPVLRPDAPEDAAVRGAARLIAEPELLERLAHPA